jgi:formyl-CoA transferase
MKALGLDDGAHEKAITDPDALARHYAALRSRAEAVLAGRTTREWRTIFDAHGLPASDVKLAFELLDDEQALANGLLHDLPHPALGPVRVLAPPLTLDGQGFRPGAPTPPLGAETRALLTELGFTAEEITALLADGVTRDLERGR